MKLQQKAEMLGEKTFLGVPVQDFEKGGRELFIYSLNAGLTPDAKFVDIGCGVLRGGYWLIHFLDRGCYCGIEPHTGKLEMGTHTILEPEILAAKRPRFDTNCASTLLSSERSSTSFWLTRYGPTRPSRRSRRCSTHFSATRKTAACFSPPTCRRAGGVRITKAKTGTGRVTSQTSPAAFIIVCGGSRQSVRAEG